MEIVPVSNASVPVKAVRQPGSDEKRGVVSSVLRCIQCATAPQATSGANAEAKLHGIDDVASADAA